MLVRKYYCALFMCVATLMSQCVVALPPLPFSADYEVRFVTGFRATANLTLKAPQANRYEMSSSANLKIFGKSVTKVAVGGEFILEAENIIPQTYEYVQTGLGHRTSGIDYDWFNSSASALVNDDEVELPLLGTMFDELSMYVEIQQQAAAGLKDIYLNVIDGDEVKEYHYTLLGEERLKTKLGLFNTVKYLRVRGEDSKRNTELWLAKDWQYLVLQLSQKTKIRTFKINMLHAIVNDVEVVSLD